MAKTGDTATAGFRLALLPGLCLTVLALAASPAHAAKGWVFKETLGGLGKPSFNPDRGMVVDQAGEHAGDVLVLDTGAKTLSRWNADGTPSEFAALDSNVIDGKAGPEGKSCGEEPASCDQTPTTSPTGILGNSVGAKEAQVAIDDSGGATDGNIYVTNVSKDLVDVFSSDGEFLGQLTGTAEGAFGANHEPCGVAVDDGGNVYVGDFRRGVHKYVPSGAVPDNGDAPGPPFSPNLVCTLVAGGGFVYPNTFDSTDTFKLDATSGALKYVFGSAPTTSTRDRETGHVLVASGNTVTEYDVSSTTQAEAIATATAAGTVEGTAVELGAEILYVARAGSEEVDVFEAVTAPEVETGPPSAISGAKTTVTGEVRPEGLEITDCTFEYGKTTSYGQEAPCNPEGSEIPEDFGAHEVVGELTGLLANGTTYHYRVRIDSEVGEFEGEDGTFKTADTYSTDPAAAVGKTTATLKGTVRPEGVALTDCRFEYGTSFLSSKVPCEPEAGEVPNVDADVEVSAIVTGLDPSSSYRYRLVAENALGQIVTAEQTFNTTGPPVIVEQTPIDVTQTGATLRARINPAGSPTSVHFEWGPQGSYPNRIPADHELPIGSGTAPVTLTASPQVSLSPRSTYQFRVVASNGSETTVGDDQLFSTLNSDGLAWGRRYEQVSPADKGPVGEAGQSAGVGGGELLYQAAPDGNAIQYGIGFGLEEAMSGGEVTYLSTRSLTGWITKQVKPSLEDSRPTPEGGDAATRGYFNRWLSRDLQCALTNTSMQLTDDAVARVAIEAGGHNLYRRNPDLSYDLVTNLPPLNLNDVQSSAPGAYTIAGAAQDCSRVIFETKFRYPGVPFTSTGGAANLGLYEWNAGTLGNPSPIAGSSTPEFPAVAVPGAGPINGSASYHNALSEDGSRFYFTTDGAGTSSPLGHQALFLSEKGKEAIDISTSQTGTPNDADVRFQMATADGAEVLFIGRDGLAANDEQVDSSACTLGNGNDLGVGCELYRYSVDDEELVDLSPGTHPDNPEGASVAGVLDASADASRVYFAAKGQLTEGEGQTYAQNSSEATRGYNLYLWEEGEGLVYLTTIGQGDVIGGGGNQSRMLVSGSQGASWTSQTTPSGSHLLFQSTANLIGYDSGGEEEIYRYSAVMDDLVCVSCRRDEQPSLGSDKPGEAIKPPLQLHSEMPSLSADGSTVFFEMNDALASGAVEGEHNLYEWRAGQVSLLAAPAVTGSSPELKGASEDGTSVFLASRRALVPWDNDGGVSDIYVARVGGGFPPPADSEPCDPLQEGSCGETSATPDAPAAPASSVLAPSGNVREAAKGRGSCARLGARAKRVATRAKRLARKAKHLRSTNRRRAARMHRNARRLGKRARALSGAAKRCRQKRSANTTRRAGR